MTREELKALLTGDFEKVKAKFDDLEKKVKIKDKTFAISDILKQYDPFEHDVMEVKLRPDKIIDVEGQEYKDSITGEIKNEIGTELVEVNRLPVPVQKKIVLIAAAFLVGEKISIESLPSDSNEQTLLDMVNKVWRDNKLDFKSKEIAKLMMSETHCAELWYDYAHDSYWNGTVNEGIKRKPGVYILAESKGDKIRAVFDQYNDMIAFMRGYEVTVDGKEVEHLDIYTEDQIINAVKGTDNWDVTPKANPYKAIPVIYYSQDRAEWSDVQPLIDRKETKLSNNADSNDYFGDPALVASGDVENLPRKGEIGKQFKVTGGGSVEILAHDGASVNTHKEFDMLNDEIHAGTHTPQIDFNTMKDILGSGTSGIALKLLFMDPQMKASDKQEKFGEMIQRRLNFIIKMLVSFNSLSLEKASGLVVSPKFRPFMPINDVEFNELLIKAYEAGMISRQTMIEKSTLVNDAKAELKQIEKEKAAGINVKEKDKNDKNLD